MNKKFFSFIVITAVFAAVFTSCIKDKPEVPEVFGQIEVNLSANITSAPISSSLLKIADGKFEVTDKIGLYMKPAGQQLSAAYSNAVNVLMSLSGQMLVANPTLYYPESGNVDIIAYYPYATPVNSGHTVNVNVAGQSSGLPVEVLYSNNVTNQAPTTTAVVLNFRYSLAKIEVTVSCDELSAADFASITASIEGLNTQAKLQLADGTVIDRSAVQAISLYKKANTASSVTFEALILPSVAPEKVDFVFTFSGKTYRSEQTIKFEAPNLYRLQYSICNETLTNVNIEERTVIDVGGSGNDNNLPTLSTIAAINISSTSATLGGFINSTGIPAYTERGIVYATTPNPTTANNKIIVAGTSAGSFSADIAGLAAGTAYYVRAYSINAIGTAYGNEVVFTTLNAQTSGSSFTENFENGHGTMLTGWTFVNGSQYNQWRVGTATKSGGERSCYISYDNGTTNTYYGYSGFTNTVHFYRDIDFLSTSETHAKITFDWKCVGNSSDYLAVYVLPTTTTPAAGTLLSNPLVMLRGSSTWQQYEMTVPITGNSRRLVFTWRNSASTANQAPAAIDNIVVTGVEIAKNNSNSITEGFENGQANMLSDWTFVNGSQYNQWRIGTATANGGSRSCYISYDNGMSNTYYGYSGFTNTVHFYRDINFSTTHAKITFDWKCVGNSSDYLAVYLVSTGTTPVAGTLLSNPLVTLRGQSSWQKYEMTVPIKDLKRLVFTWRNSASSANQPPAAIDNIVITGVTP